MSWVSRLLLLGHVLAIASFDWLFMVADGWVTSEVCGGGKNRWWWRKEKVVVEELMRGLVLQQKRLAVLSDQPGRRIFFFLSRRGSR